MNECDLAKAHKAADEEEKDAIQLMQSLGGEHGLKKIVTIALSKSNAIFASWKADDKTKCNMYTYFIAAMIDEEFEWMATTMLSNNSGQLQIQERDFDELLKNMKSACLEHNLSKGVVETLLDTL